MNEVSELINDILIEVEDRETRQNALEIKEKLQSSLSPEYKSLWSDVNIQGDYDQYARSAAPSRRLQSDNTPPKKDEDSSPRSKELSSSNGGPSPRNRRSRVKLGRSADQQPQEVLTSQQHTTAGSDRQAMESDAIKTDVKLTANRLEASFTESNQAKNEEETEEETSQLQTKADEKLQHASRNSKKSNKEFTPPIVTAVDFREPTLSNAVRFATRNGLLVESPNAAHEYRNQDGTMSRLSTLFMANYLGVGIEPSPNVITSIVVKPLLPPLKPKRSTIRRQRVKDVSESDNHELQIPDRKVNDSRYPDSNGLAPLRGGHLYRWKHSGVAAKSPTSEINEHPEVKRTRYRLPRDGDAESIFDHVVRWRSKARHCGKPAMYRRITSPTLGEVALRRKLTDRLPTRQVRKNRPDAKDLQPREESESWRRPRSRITVNTSVKQFIKQRLRDAHKDGSLTSPHVIEGFYDVTMSMKEASKKAAAQENQQNDAMMDVPLPEIPLRKRRPVWQRMR